MYSRGTETTTTKTKKVFSVITITDSATQMVGMVCPCHFLFWKCTGRGSDYACYACACVCATRSHGRPRRKDSLEAAGKKSLGFNSSWDFSLSSARSNRSPRVSRAGSRLLAGCGSTAALQVRSIEHPTCIGSAVARFFATAGAEHVAMSYVCMSV